MDFKQKLKVGDIFIKYTGPRYGMGSERLGVFKRIYISYLVTKVNNKSFKVLKDGEVNEELMKEIPKGFRKVEGNNAEQFIREKRMKFILDGIAKKLAYIHQRNEFSHFEEELLNELTEEELCMFDDSLEKYIKLYVKEAEGHAISRASFRSKIAKRRLNEQS